MKKISYLINMTTIICLVVHYNLKIIFANRFVYFLGAALGIFSLVTVLNLFKSDSSLSEGTVYWLLLVPGMLLVFYPTVFGIQNDVDTRMIEILFGIPNYRYKVWLVRLLLIFLMVYVILLLLGFISSLVLAEISVLTVTLQLMFPVLFIGSLAFMLSTFIRNGSGTAVVMVIIGLGLWIAQSTVGMSKWNVFLNPFSIPQNINEVVWAETILNNRIYLLVGTVILVLYGLLNLQKREKFI